MKRLLPAFFGFLLFPFFSSAQLSGSYTIDSSGTGSRNFLSVTEAVDSLVKLGIAAEIVFELAPAVYFDSIVFKKPIVGASAQQKVKFRGQTSDSSLVVLDGLGSTTIAISAAKYISFESFTIRNSLSSVVTTLRDGADSIDFKSCHIIAENGSRTAIYARDNQGLGIYDTRIEAEYAGLSLRGSNSLPYTGVVIQNSEIVQCEDYAIDLRLTEGVNIIGNTLQRGSLSDRGVGLRIRDSRGDSISGNKVLNYGTGLLIQDLNDGLPDTSYFVNNMVVSGNYGINAQYNENLRFFHNTVLGIKCWTSAYFYSNENDEYFNNLFATDSSAYGVYIYYRSGNGPKMDYNAYHFEGTSFFAYNNNSYSSFNDFVTADTVDHKHAIQVNPKFWSGEVLVPGSDTLNNAGLDLGISLDGNGDPRPYPLDKGVDIGCFEYHRDSFSLKFDELISPEVAAVGSNKLQVSLRNRGIEEIVNTDLELLYSLDSGINWAIDTMSIGSLAPDSTISFGFTKPIVISKGGAYQVRLKLGKRISGKSIVADKKIFSICTGLSGVYTVGVGQDFRTLSDVSKALACGVYGPVDFKFSPGVYKGSLRIGEIPGASAINRVKFTGVQGDSTKVLFKDSLPQLVVLKGASYVALEYLTLETNFNGVKTHLRMAGSSNFNTVSHCQFLTPDLGRGGVNIVLSGCKSARIEHSLIDGNSSGIRVMEDDLQEPNNTSLYKNTITNHRDYGISASEVSGFDIVGNTINSATVDTTFNTSEEVLLDHCANFNIEANRIKTYGVGLWLNRCNPDSVNQSGQIINNEIVSNGSYAMYNSRLRNTNIEHNTMLSTGANSVVYDYYQRNTRWTNNNIVGYSGTHGMQLYFDYPALPVFEHNNYFFVNSTSSWMLVNWMGYDSIENLRSTFPLFDSTNRQAPPHFRSTKKLIPYSNVLNNAGKTIGINTDIEGAPRPHPLDKGVDIGAYEFYLKSYDLVAWRLKSPLSVKNGANKIEVDFKNTGRDTLFNTQVLIQYSVDSGKAFVDDTLFITRLVPGATVNHEFTTSWVSTRIGDFLITIKVKRVISGNPLSESERSFERCSGLEGSYTVGAGGDYRTISEAVNALQCGIVGAVVFNIEDGIYNEQVKIGKIAGASPLHTVSFKGSKNVIVTHQALASTDFSTWTMFGTRYVRIEGITIKASGKVQGSAILFTNGAQFISIKHCAINVSPGAGYTAGIAISGSSVRLSSGKSASHVLIDSNDISGGYYGIYSYGDPYGETSQVDHVFRGNYLSDYRYYGLYISGIDSMVLVKGNKIYGTGRNQRYPLSVDECNYFEIDENQIVGRYGVYMNYCNERGHNETDYSSFTNNSVICDSMTSALYFRYVSYVNFYHNSILGNGDNSVVQIGRGEKIDLRNNHLVQLGSGQVFSFDSPDFSFLDNNNYYGPKASTLGYNRGISYTNISSLRNSWGYNKTVFSTNPAFADNRNDLHLTASSPLMIGANLGVLVDIDGDARCITMPILGSDDLVSIKFPSKASMVIQDTLWKNAPVTILNTSKLFGYEEFRWYVNGAFVSDSMHLSFVPKKRGYITISLAQNTCTSADSVAKKALVHRPKRKPTADFYVPERDVYVRDFVELFNLSTHGATKFNWQLSPVFRLNEEFGLWDRGFYWSFKNDSTSANPKLEFYYPGLYGVCMKVRNIHGEDSVCKNDYIKVRARETMCGASQVSASSFGTLYDDGGPLENYSAGKNGSSTCTYQIKNCSGIIQLKVKDLNIGQGDYLRLYDGIDNKGAPLWDEASAPLGLSGTIGQINFKPNMTAFSGSVFVEFESDWSNQTVSSGFALNWDFVDGAFSGPRAAFLVSDTLCEGFNVSFENISKGAVSYIWDVFNDHVDDTSSTDLTYDFPTVGTYEVKLRVSDHCGRLDSFVKEVTVVKNLGLTKPRFVVNKNFGAVGDTFNLIDRSNLCAEGTQWKVWPSYFYETRKGELSKSNASIVFTQSGDFTIGLYKTNDFGTDSLIKLDYIQVKSYCQPTVNFVDSSFSITRVRFKEIDQKSAGNIKPFSDYTHKIVEVEKGTTYPIDLEFFKSEDKKNLMIWVDWSGDFDFDDSGELVVSLSIPGSEYLLQDSVMVPETAVSGLTRMRIALLSSERTGIPCGGSYLGEYEDYSLLIEGTVSGAPEIRLLGNVLDTAHLMGLWNEPGFTAIDPVDGNITSNVVISGSVNTSQPGRYVLVYEVVNSALLKSTVRRYVYVSDFRPPHIALKDTSWLEVNASFVPSAYTVIDGSDPNPKVKIYGRVDSSRLGSQYVKYCAVDLSGNEFCKEQVLIVYDDTAPIIQLNGTSAEQVEVYHQYIDEGYTITDNDIENVEVTLKGDWTGNTSALGTFVQLYEAIDRAGNRSSVSRTIQVVDRTPPVLILRDSLVETVERWSEFVDPGFEVSDNYDDSLSIEVSIAGSYENTQSEGIYFISYIATDKSGNESAPILRLVKVVNFTGISNASEDGIYLYPNPASEIIQVHFPQTVFGQGELLLTDLTGRRLIEKSWTGFEGNKLSIDIRKIVPGVYSLQLIANGQSHTRQVIITR